MDRKQEDDLEYLNEGLDGRTEYHFYWDRDVLAIWFYVGADRKRKTTSLARPQTVTSEFRAEARRRAIEITTVAKRGRVLEAVEVDRVQVSSSVDELMEAWIKIQERQYPASWKTRRIQVRNVVSLFKGLDDGMMTPLQRMVDDEGPQLYLDERMRQRDKETVKKEVGILFMFLDWMKSKRYITTVPPKPKYRAKDLGTRMGPQRDEPVHLEDDVALRIIMRLPEYAARGGRKDIEGAKLPESAFVCRDWMRFAFETGLRPSTVARLRVDVHWTRGADFVRITPDIDKSRNEGHSSKVRNVPITKVAKDILMKHAPKEGIIFGKPDGTPHDIRVQWKRAAIAELGRVEGLRCAPYDLRHGANFRMRSTVAGSLGGSMHLVGHSKASTNDRYMRPAEKAAREVVGLLNARNAELEGKPVRRAVRKEKGSRA